MNTQTIDQVEAARKAQELLERLTLLSIRIGQGEPLPRTLPRVQ